jgi:hypothetical protein
MSGSPVSARSRQRSAVYLIGGVGPGWCDARPVDACRGRARRWDHGTHAASAHGASGPGHAARPAEASDVRAAAVHQLAVGRLVHLAPSLDAARGDAEPAVRRGTAWPAHAGRSRCARRIGHPAPAAAPRSRGPRVRLDRRRPTGDLRWHRLPRTQCHRTRPQRVEEPARRAIRDEADVIVSRGGLRLAAVLLRLTGLGRSRPSPGGCRNVGRSERRRRSKARIRGTAGRPRASGRPGRPGRPRRPRVEHGRPAPPIRRPVRGRRCCRFAGAARWPGGIRRGHPGRRSATPRSSRSRERWAGPAARRVGCAALPWLRAGRGRGPGG